MLNMNYPLWCVSVLVSTVIATAPSRAEACSIIECERLVDVELTQAGPIPAGATALVLRPVLADEFARFNPEKSAVAVVMTVTPTMGGPAVPGEVVAIDVLDLLVWRPGAPLDPDTEYEVAVTIDNSMLDYSECGPDALDRTFTVTTGAAMVVPVTLSEVTTSAMIVSTPFLSPDTLVCCDGAIPIDESGSCGDPLAWFEGTCSAGSAFASLTVTATIDPATVAAGMGQVGYHFFDTAFVPGASETTLRSNDSFCSQLTAVHLMTGETMTGPEVCVGDDLADMLGTVPFDPAPGLAMCAGEPYTCAVASGPNGELWDSENCTPWPEGQATTDADPTTGGGPTTGETPTTGGTTGEPGSSGEDTVGGTGDDGGEKGCACASTNASAPWGLAVLLACPRRRRARRA